MTVRVALDYDGVVTKDPHVFLKVVKDFQKAGWDVTIVTMRFRNEPVIVPKGFPTLEVIYTGRKAKKPFIAERYNLTFDIWIDDHPQLILMDAFEPDPDDKHSKNKWDDPKWEEYRSSSYSEDVVTYE